MADTYIEIFTRSNKQELYCKASYFWPNEIERHRCVDFDDWKDAGRFLWHVIKTAKKFAVVCDEDCFITDWVAVEAIANRMHENMNTHAGMPDGGVCPHRCHSWVTMNPFFLVLDCELIRKMLNEGGWEEDIIDQHGFMPEMNGHKPRFISDNYTHTNAEPFHGLFYWLARYSPLYLNAWGHPDGISTALRVPSPHGEVFALHSWYSREYGTDDKHTSRINRIYEEARYYSALQG